MYIYMQVFYVHLLQEHYLGIHFSRNNVWSTTYLLVIHGNKPLADIESVASVTNILAIFCMPSVYVNHTTCLHNAMKYVAALPSCIPVKSQLKCSMYIFRKIQFSVPA